MKKNMNIDIIYICVYIILFLYLCIQVVNCENYESKLGCPRTFRRFNGVDLD